MKLLQLIFMVFLIHTYSYSQEFSKGKIIKAEGDTLNGFIQDTRIRKMTERCLFLKTLESKDTIVFKPFEISSYEVNEKIFVSKILKKGDNKQYSIFAIKLVTGRVALYQYNDVLLVEKNNIIEILSKKDSIIDKGAKYVMVSGVRVIMANKYFQYKFIYQLDSLFKDCANRLSILNNKLVYTEESIAETVVKYNNCVGNLGFVYTKPKAQKRVYLKILGASASIQNPNALLTNTITNKGNFLGLGVSYQIGGDKMINKRFLNQFDLDFVKFNIPDSKFSSSFLSITPLIQYALKNPNNNGYAYFEAGLRASIRLDESDFGTSIPLGFGYQTGWKSKTKLQFNVKYYKFKLPPFYQFKNIVASIGYAF